MTLPRNPFTRTGALRLNHPLFRGRAAELARLQQACLSDLDFFLLVYGGRQNGKTTVLLRLEAGLRERIHEGVRVCRVDFQSLPRASAQEAYRYLARNVARVLPNPPSLPNTFDAPVLGDFLEDALAGDTVQRLVLLLDELATLPDDTREDLAHVLRALHTRRLGSPALAKAQFALAGGIELYRLAVVEASTLRNVCEIVRLGDLNETDTVDLVADGLVMVGLEQEDATTLGRTVYARVNGHPYLTQRLGEQLAKQHLDGDTPDEAAVDQLAWALLEHDDPLLEHLRRSIAELGLEDAARRLLSASQRTSRTDDATERLDLLGIARRAGRHWEPRSPLFSIALAEWLGLPVPGGIMLPQAAIEVQAGALEQYLNELKLEQAAIEQRAPATIDVAEHLHLRRRAGALMSEIDRIEALRLPVTPPPTAPLAPPPVMPPHEPDSQDELRSLLSAQLPVESTPSSPGSAQRQAPPPVISSTVRHSSPITHHSSLPAWVPELINIPAGSFLMGSSNNDPLADGDEKPQHRLELPDYWIGKTPVTNAQFRPFVEGDGYTNRAYWTTAGWQWREREKISRPEYWDSSDLVRDEYPVIGVSWLEAVAYCRWLSAQTGIEFRLPTEAEWEKAARGSDGWIWPWGNTWESGRCNNEEAGIGKTTPVGQYPAGASPYGVFDMAGNVWEWCATHWQKEYPYVLENEWAATYLERDVDRVFRGGSWYSERKNVRGAYRNGHLNPRFRYDLRGLRVARHSPTRPES